ncbi:MAG: DUF3048 domain-containing protein [Actinomycetota bacterium]|nr:DUF3048 domain-containing protein [Actinomycetota bacterium]
MGLARRRTAAALPVAMLLLAAACGGGDDDAARGRSPVEPTTTTLPPTAPLTGLPVSDPAILSRMAVAVKIDNDPVSRPQAGLDKADVVYEEITEGITRFVAVFQSTDAEAIGPVRSVRPADPRIVAPLKGLFAFSGGSPAALELVRSAGLNTVTENDTDTLRRRSGRRAPYNLYTSTEALFAKAPDGATAPPRFAQFLRQGEPFNPPGATPATRVTVEASPGVTATYEWDPASSTFKRSTNGSADALEGGGQIAPTNVIVQFTPYSRFSADAKVTFPEVVGSGDAVFFAGGSTIRGRWTKTAPDAVTTYTDAAGAPISLPPGRTLVELVPPGSGITTA